MSASGVKFTRTFGVCVLFSFASLIPFAPAPAAPDAAKPVTPALRERPDSFADMVEPLLPAVVNISSTQKASAQPQDEQDDEGGDNGDGGDNEGGGAQPQTPQQMPQLPPGSPFEQFFNQFQHKGMEAPAVPMSSLGSGFVIDADKGLVITNNHVVKDAEDVRVTFQDNETVKATILGRDEKMDLAVLQIKTKKKIAAVKFGDSDKMRVGDWVVAIGNPFGLGGTVTAGIVSARQRDINAGPYDDFIQTDASINRGNSGGPMFNTNGEVIGINTAIFSPSGGSVGIGFAIPSDLAKPVIDQLIQFGHTKRGWLGVRIQSVTPEIAESLGLPEAEGAMVASITPKSPAEIAGLKAGDVILEFNGQKLNAMRQLPRLVAEAPTGTEATLLYWRGGKQATAKIKVGELEKAEKDGLLTPGEPTSSAAAGVKVPSVGVTLSAIDEAARKSYNIPAEVDGVLVSGVANMSEAAIKGLLEGDVIVEINQLPAGTPQKAADTIAKAKKEGKGSVLLLLNREGDVRFVALKLSENDKDEAKPEATKATPKTQATPAPMPGIVTPEKPKK